MASTAPTTCPHERGRGTTVCLRCRHDEWQASQRRRQQLLMRLIGVGFVGGIVAVIGLSAAGSLGGDKVTQTSSGAVASADSQTVPQLQGAPAQGRLAEAIVPTSAATPRVGTPTPSSGAPIPPASAPTPAAPATAPAATAGLIVPEGRTPLTDSIYALRTGESVIVNFDYQGNRTGRADKFERTLRATLPLVYGKAATAALDSIADGALIPSRDLLGDARQYGIRLQLDKGLIIRIWPIAREFRDGPLIASYRSVVER